MAFISTSFASRYPPTNNQLRTSSNPRNQATIQDGRATIQNVQGRQSQGYTSSGSQGNVAGVNRSMGSTTASQAKAMELGATDDLDAFDSDCDEAPSASAGLMAKLSAYDSGVLSEMIKILKVQVIVIVISYEQYLREFENEVVQGTTPHAQQDSLIIFVIEEMSNQVAQFNAVNKENKTVNESLTTEIERYKEQFADLEKEIQSLKLHLEAHMSANKMLTTTVDILKKVKKAKEDKFIDEIIDLEKKIKELDNIVYKMGQSTQTMHMLTKPQVFYDDNHKTALGYKKPLYLTKAQRKQPALYCGQTIVKKHNVLFVLDSEETLDLAKASRLSDHFSAHFVPQKRLSVEQAFWLPLLKSTIQKPPVQTEPVPKEIPRELPTISLVKDRFNKMWSHVNNFDKVITVRTKVTGQNERTSGFKHIRGAFEKDVIPFAKTLKEYFKMFDQGLAKEITDMKEVFNQMENEVDKSTIERKLFEIKEKELVLENERLLEHILYQDILYIVM
ncbi:hypothetical protein Tco_0086006 [Tanacetum coccineum]